MEIEFECKHCHRPIYRTLARLRDSPGLQCPSCSKQASTETFIAALDGLAAQMVELRQHFRFDVTLISDALPAPHGFDESYTLPDDNPVLIGAETTSETTTPEKS